MFSTKQLSFRASLLMIAAFAAISPLQAQETLSVFACEPEWAALAKEIGGDTVTVYSATTAEQDPHHIQARPSLIAKARKADVLICSGAELEIGWLPVLLKKSGNPKIQPQSPGHIMATDYVTLLGKVEKVTRAMGDVHGAGNPHVHLDPKRMVTISQEVANRLGQINPAMADKYKENSSNFSNKINTLNDKFKVIFDDLSGKRWVVHHDNWVYLNEWLGLEQVATLEPKPGVPPTTRHLAKLTKEINADTVSGIAYGSYQPEKAARWLSNKTGVPVIATPYTISDWQQEDAIIRWYETLLNTLHSGFKASNNG